MPGTEQTHMEPVDDGAVWPANDKAEEAHLQVAHAAGRDGGGFHRPWRQDGACTIVRLQPAGAAAKLPPAACNGRLYTPPNPAGLTCVAGGAAPPDPKCPPAAVHRCAACDRQAAVCHLQPAPPALPGFWCWSRHRDATSGTGSRAATHHHSQSPGRHTPHCCNHGGQHGMLANQDSTDHPACTVCLAPSPLLTAKLPPRPSEEGTDPCTTQPSY